jgi:hypothetical protein
MTEESNGTTKRLVRAGIASAASGAIAYGIRKAAPALREKVQSIGEDGAVPETLGKAKDAVGEKVEAATSAVTDRFGGGSSGPSRSSGSLSEKELESRLHERARNRSKRQKALTR